MGEARETTKPRRYLSNIDKLPPECDLIVAEAAEALRDNKQTQTEIYRVFHSALEALKAEYRGELEFDIPSFSAFNRFSVKLYNQSRRMEEVREIAGSLAEKFDAGKSDEITILAAEAIKTLVFELVMEGGEAGHDPKGAMQLANALRAAAQAQGVSSKRRAQVEKDLEANAREAMGKVQKQTGMSDEAAQAVIDKILGRAD